MEARVVSLEKFAVETRDCLTRIETRLEHIIITIPAAAAPAPFTGKLDNPRSGLQPSFPKNE
jgi:hypothetical protein